jgi:NAD(P)H-hydrate epimerase
MRLLTVDQSHSVEGLAETQYHLNSEQLMESAGAAVVEVVQSIFKDKKKKILILVGPGNNGADGFVVARLLKRKGFMFVRCQLVKSSPAPKPIWILQKEKAANSGVEMFDHSVERLKLEISESDLIIDAIFGIGFRGTLPEEIAALIQFINSKKVLVLSVDCPSGLSPQTGFELPVAFRARWTVSFGLAKPGFFVSRGPRCVGQLTVHDIGFPTALLRSESGSHFAWGEKATQSVLPTRTDDSYKGDNGSVYAFAGSTDYPGAGLLVAKAAGRMGAGYVYLISSDIYQQIPLAPEVIFRQRSEFTLKSLDKKMGPKDVFVVGPGLGVNKDTADLVRELKKRRVENVILDADALTVCAQENLFPVPASWIVTPHAGELARILGTSTKVLSQDRFQAAQQAAQKCGCVALFKGFRTVVSDGTRSIVILSGNAALGKAGSGDVLAGFIGALRAQGLGPVAAACCAAYLHGRLADDWLRSGQDVLSLLPSDLSERVPRLLHEIRKK